MKIPKTVSDLLSSIHRNTKCDWTKGYLDRFFYDLKNLPEDKSSIGEAEAKAKELLQDFSTNPIVSVKKIRDYFGFTLLESKNLVDNYRDSGKIVWPEGYDPEIDTNEDDDDFCIPV